jgi:HECT-domain (ubiquitin-transferase)
VDASLGRGLQYLLDFEQGSIAAVLGTTFTASENPLLDSAATATASISTRYVALKAGGEDIYVDRSNRGEFVQLFVNHALYGSAKPLVDAYIAGLTVLMDGPLLKLCTHTEVETLLIGSAEIGDLSELRIRTVYRGCYDDEHPIIEWFWTALSELTVYEKHKFLHFVTGSDRVPVGGISKLGLTIMSTGQPNTSLPSSHTCFSILNIPSSYESLENVQERLKLALEYYEGFGFA